MNVTSICEPTGSTTVCHYTGSISEVFEIAVVMAVFLASGIIVAAIVKRLTN